MVDDTVVVVPMDMVAAAPVAPVAPAVPVAPVAPVSPLYPCGPLGPVVVDIFISKYSNTSLVAGSVTVSGISALAIEVRDRARRAVARFLSIAWPSSP